MISKHGKKYLEMKQKSNRDTRKLGPIVQFRDSGTTVASQTQYTLSFAVPIAQKQLFDLFIDGSLLTEGTDFDFIEIAGGTSSKIELSAAPPAGLDISYKLNGARIAPFPNPETIQATLNNEVGQPREWAEGVFEDYVQESLIDAPHTTIVNRAQINESLVSSMGIERIPAIGVKLLPEEFGPNGEAVYSFDEYDPRIRIVGATDNVANANQRGSYVAVENYAEVTFYGTGLNLVMAYNTTISIMASIDGGSESEVWTQPASVLDVRNYAANIVMPVAEGLTRDWHTIKLRNADSNWYSLQGFEILNESTDVAVTSGVGFAGTHKNILSALVASTYNDGISGTKGARVVKYLKDGVVSQVVQEVDATAQYLSSTDHSNEEVIRKINWREFGANRADDFSTLTTSISDRVFTLDDGVTTLIGQSVVKHVSSPDNVFTIDTVGKKASLIFVGTGLDIMTGDAVVSASDTITLFVDGVSRGALPQVENKRIKLCSGLPYGTHIVSIERTVLAVGVMTFSDFIVYGPKEPTLPQGATWLADYNVRADFVANTTADALSIATGVLRKPASREFLYEGAGWLLNINTSYSGGFDMYSATSGAKASHTFLGEGFDFRFRAESNRSSNISVYLNGTLLTAANFPTASFSTYGTGVTFNSTTGILDQNDASSSIGAGFTVTGLPIGSYKLEFVNNTTNRLTVHALDIITPIHVNDIKVGSLGLIANTQYTPIPKELTNPRLGEVKAWLVYDGSANKILDSHGISSVVDLATGQYAIFLSKKFKGEVGMTMGIFGHPYAIAEHGGYPGLRTQASRVVYCFNSSTTSALDAKFYVAFFGELEGEE